MDYNLLKKQIKFNGYTIEQIAQKIGVTRNGLSTTIKNDTLKVRDLEKICKILEVDINIFFEKNRVSGNNVNIGDNNLQGNQSSFEKINQTKQTDAHNEIEKLKKQVERLEKEIKSKDKQIKELLSDKDFLKKIIDKKL